MGTTTGSQNLLRFSPSHTHSSLETHAKNCVLFFVLTGIAKREMRQTAKPFVFRRTKIRAFNYFYVFDRAVVSCDGFLVLARIALAGKNGKKVCPLTPYSPE